MVKTLPPELKLYLVDKQLEDHCRALIQDSLTFDITPILPTKVDSVKISVNNQYVQTIAR